MGRTISSLRSDAREAIDKAHVVADPERALWPVGTSMQRDDSQEAAKTAHDAVLKYTAALPSMHRRGQRWDERLAEFEFPDGTTLGLSLAGSERWEDIKYSDHETDIQQVYLPPSYCRELFRQADRIARNAGLVTADNPKRAKHR